jgi:hypothetical protein
MEVILGDCLQCLGIIFITSLNSTYQFVMLVKWFQPETVGREAMDAGESVTGCRPWDCACEGLAGCCKPMMNSNLTWSASVCCHVLGVARRLACGRGAPQFVSLILVRVLAGAASVFFF